MDFVYSSLERCSGCTACRHICPTEAIIMVRDDKGFFYPSIDQERCIDCQKCKKVCPFIVGDLNKQSFEEPLVFAAKHKDSSVRMLSSSGGVFTQLTDNLFNTSLVDVPRDGEISGVVYGAAFNESFEVEHARGTTQEERNRFRGSKYVKSDLSSVFAQVKADLEAEYPVVFSGTACEVAGLKNYLKLMKISDQRLILVDIVCHGGPSPKIWKDYVSFIQHKELLQQFTFRNKEKAWRGFNVKATYQSGRIKANTPRLLTYTYLYGADLMMRESCYQCPYTTHHRVSDIMLGDFWGIENAMPEFEDAYGVSLVYLNTEKGKAFFESTDSRLELKEMPLATSLQFNLRKSTPKPTLTESFWKLYSAAGFEAVAKSYGAYSLKGYLKKRIAQLLRELKLKKH